MSINLREPDFRAAVFDLDGTLFDSMMIWNRIDEIFLARRGINEVPEDYLLAIAHLGAIETANYTIKRFGLTDTPEQMIQEWSEQALDFYRNEVTLKKGALGYLTKLRNAGIHLAVATASSEDLYLPAIKRCGLDGFFEAYANVGECERKKGFPDVYLLACQRMNADPADAVVFEDIYVAIKGAKSGGFRTAGVYDETSARDTELIKAEAVEFIFSFEELL